MKIRIEMNVPDNVDPSALLDLAQEWAVEINEDNYENDDDEELTEEAKETVRMDVSVEIVTE